MEDILDELERLKRKCIFVNQFMLDYGGFPMGMRPFLRESNKRIQEAHTSCNLRLLRLMSQDLDREVIKCMPFSMALKMKSQFKAQVGLDLREVLVIQKEKVKEILQAGKIDNGDEYLLVKDYINWPENNLMPVEEVVQLKFLMTKFLTL